MNEALDWALSIDETSVIITRWPCAIKKLSNGDKKEFPDAFTNKYKVNELNLKSAFNPRDY